MHFEVFKDKLWALLQYYMVKILKVKFIQRRFLYYDTDTSFVKPFGEVDDELRQFFPEISWKCRCLNFEVFDYPKNIPETSGLSIKLALRVSLAYNFYLVRFIL
jgi:hypothetical protein